MLMSGTEPSKRIEIYDTTLRDGAQGMGVAFGLIDKIKIAQCLDSLGVDYIEGGYPLSNPKDEAFFREAAKLSFQHAKVCAFGMTRRRGVAVQDDPGMKALVGSGTEVITIVGKTWDLHVDQVLQISRQENLDMIQQSVAYCRATGGAGAGGEVFYDAEHFFDGYRANAAYALETLRAAIRGGAARLILCDTNGGSLPDWVSRVVKEVATSLEHEFSGGIGIHAHNDSGVAVANSLAAVETGAIQVQGTINGIGERCGNVDLTTVAANLRLKMGYDCLNGDSLTRLTETSRFVYDLANMNLQANQPFVGSAAFAHKGGMHVHAVRRITHSYEHIKPESVGNTRRVLVSELSGVSNIAATLGPKFEITSDKDLQRRVLRRVQDMEHEGYQFEAATASFELLLHSLMDQRPVFWDLDHYRCVILKRDGDASVTEATVKLVVNGQVQHQVAEGDGPINALDSALRKCLQEAYPQLSQVHLRDYKVRVVNPTAESAAKVRVLIEFAIQPRVVDAGAGDTPIRHHTTIGVNENIIDASWEALTDAFTYHLIECGALEGLSEEGVGITRGESE